MVCPHQQHSTMLNMNHSLIMDKLNNTLLDLLHSNPNYPFSLSQFSILQNALLRNLSDSEKTPTHLPYSAMIQASIVKLDEECSLTTEKMISEHILKNYQGLPWAHTTILKHHLDKLCQGGELIFDDHDDDKTYNVPGKKRHISLRRKLLKLKLSSKTKENEVVEEGNVAPDEVTELSDSQIGIQEDESKKLGRRKRRRRHSFISDEEEDEDFEKMIVDGEGNRDNESGKEMVLVETVNEMLLLKGGDVKCESNELEQLHPRNPEEDHGIVDIVCSKEVKNQVHEVDRDLSQVMNLSDSRGGDMMCVSSESAIEANLVGDRHDNYTSDLILSPVVVNPLASVSNIESDVIGGIIEKSDLKEAKPNPSASDLMIVPYVDNSVNLATGKLTISLLNSEKRVIVCGLYNVELEQPKKKTQVYRTRKKSKPSQEKTESLGQEPMPASFDLSLQRSSRTKVKRKLHSPKLKGPTLLKDGSVKQLEKPMSSHPISLEKIFMEDEEPLCEVYEKCGNLKKHDMQRAKAGAEFPKELPSSESFVEVSPTVEKNLASLKKTENQLSMQLRSQDPYCDNVDDTIRKSSSSFLEESGTKDSERTENQWPVMTKSNGVELYSQPFEHPIDNKTGSQHEGDQHREQQNKDDQERLPVLIEGTPEKPYLSDSHNQLLEHTSHKHSQRLNEQPENSQQKKRRGRPPNLNKSTTKEASDPSSSLQKNKSSMQDGGVRTRKRRATKKETVILLEPHLNEQERLFKQNKQLGEVGRRRLGKSKATTENATLTRGRSKKTDKLTEELLASPLNLDSQQEVELGESGNHQQSQHQNKELERGVAKIQKQGDKVDEALTSLSYEEQDGMCGQASDHHSVSQNSQPRNNSWAQSPVKGASRLTDNPKHGDVVEASHVTPEALSAQGQVDLKDQTQARRRSIRNLEPAKPLLDSQSEKLHDLELSDQKTFARSTPALMPSDNHCLEKVSVYLENEVHGKSVEIEQEKWPLDNKTHTPLSNNSNDREHPDESYDHDQAPEKMEVQVKDPKELTAKSVPIHVPLASRDQLRSRIKH
ncbi:uncharacterized protein LOC141633313 isoform X1 [Silene latifolia]|uniref:uncharacterized protein LOC141633313 isoform X1 n=1 Tax=Silene latifolia TaxID=37657 RepID=UPI003D78703B